MISAPLPHDESERLQALLSYEVLDTDAEKEFDDLVQLASQICEAEISLVSLIDSERQWFKAKVGLDADETHRDLAFCAHAILQDDVFEVENALEDERFHDNPLVADEDGLQIRFYAGMPLKNPNGLKLGTLCVIDNTPKKLTEAQKFALKTLGNQVVTQLELRLKFKDLQEQMRKVQEAQNQLIEKEKLATLGQLTANIAHEINTPLGAIRSSADSSIVAMDELLPRLSSFLYGLSKEDSAVFNRLIEYSVASKVSLSSRETRNAKYALIEDLEERDIDNAETIANLIVELGLHSSPEIYLPLLEIKDPSYTFKVAFQLASIAKSSKMIRLATDKASKIIFALKNFSRQDQLGEKQSVNIKRSIEDTLILYENQLRNRIDLHLNMEAIPIFMGYPDELVQVWTNLIHNAMQAIKKKGQITISVKQTGKTDNKKALVSVEDTGTGIPKNVQGKIFDAFFTTKKEGEGSGLGLDITKKIVEKHNGKIWFETKENEGTTFFVELPL
ncbi:ATP-binding protein [Bernardetia sp.]|uniref:GAF domain-containing sensor histidine kinase n=1 Tax=Bernardetia sp. TaxID=1937974 RepID=UPI0025B8D9F1|nr:ATP-binding protein [Bernardetia sp.]